MLAFGLQEITLNCNKQILYF